MHYEDENIWLTHDTKHYNLQMIIAVGFKVNSERAVQFRASERKFYQKITDLYATAIDYDKEVCG